MSKNSQVNYTPKLNDFITWLTLINPKWVVLRLKITTIRLKITNYVARSKIEGAHVKYECRHYKEIT